MKRFTIFMACMVAIGALYAQGTLTVTNVISEEVTGITVITYDLLLEPGKAVNGTYDITVEVSFNNGQYYFPVPPADLSGDVTGVSPGAGKQITWDGAASFPNRYSEETKVRLTATSDVFICGESTVTFSYNGSPVIYGTVVGANGRCWLDRNLGASQVVTKSNGTEAYGDLFQWGRFAEGHQVRTSPFHDAGGATTSVPNNGNAWDGKFIITLGNDWLANQDASLWQGVNGTNNPCPPGFRVPTEAEWQAEIDSWGTQNATGAFNSPLQLPVAGSRFRGDGSLNDVGSLGFYWSSNVDGIFSKRLYLFSTGATMSSDWRAYGFSVRCIKEQDPLK